MSAVERLRTPGRMRVAAGERALVLPEDLAALLAEWDVLRAQVDAVEALHRVVLELHHPDAPPVEGEPAWCLDCDQRWPCRTTTALAQAVAAAVAEALR